MNNGQSGLEIQRSIALAPSRSTTYSITTDIGTGSAIPMGGASFGSIRVVTETGMATVTGYASIDGVAANASLIYDTSGALVTLPVSDVGWFEMPSAWLSVPILHLESDNGSATIQVFTKG